MKKSLSLKKFIPIALIGIFSLISAATLIFQGDDFIWYFVNEMEEMSGYRLPNGRYFTNLLTYFMVRYPTLKFTIFIVTFTSLMAVIAHLIDFEKKSGALKYVLAFSLFVLLPMSVYSNTVTWISGFTNYVISILLTLIYVFYCFRIIFDKGYNPPKISVLVTAVLGFAGALCVENISLYNIIFGIFAVIMIFRLRKRVYISNITYLVTSVVGFIIMMSADAYSQVFTENQHDTLGIRRVETSFSDIIMQIYGSVAPDYARQFFVIHILIALCYVLLYFTADKNEWSAKRKRYAKIFLYITSIYAIYSVFVNCYEDFEMFDFSMRSKAFETAFVFIYLVSLLYLGFIFLEKSRFFRFTVYLVSSIVVMAPFAMVNPVSPRCFLADSVFWILLTGELFFVCYEKLAFFRSKELCSFISVIAVTAGVFICNFNISNKKWNDIRFDYLREQVNEKRKIVEIVELPHPSLADDDLASDSIFVHYFLDEISYTELLLKYYDINVTRENFKYMYITPIDYNNSH